MHFTKKISAYIFSAVFKLVSFHSLLAALSCFKFESKQTDSFLFPASLGDEGRADLCGRMAARYFTLAERVRSPLADPFIWLFIRPPWSYSGSCCKAVVYQHIKAQCESNLVSKHTVSMGVHTHSSAKFTELI